MGLVIKQVLLFGVVIVYLCGYDKVLEVFNAQIIALF